MKTSAIVAFTLLLTAALLADKPTKDQAAALHRAQAATFISRVAYAKAHADPVIYSGKGTLSCIVYIVKQGAGGSPGYAVVIATDKSYAPIDDLVAVSDTAAIDPAQTVKCSGHVLSVQSGWITTCADATTLTLNLGKSGPLVKFTGPHKTEPL